MKKIKGEAKKITRYIFSFFSLNGKLGHREPTHPSLKISLFFFNPSLNAPSRDELSWPRSEIVKSKTSECLQSVIWW